MKSNLLIKNGLPKKKRIENPINYESPTREQPPIVFDVDNIDQIKLLSINNVILAKQLTDNKNARTKGGIYLVGDTDFRPAEHVDREFEVVKVPNGLFYKDNWYEGTQIRTDGRSMDWKTDIEVRPGDIVWCEYMEALNAPSVKVGETIYKLLKYERLFLATRITIRTVYVKGFPDEIETQRTFPLNGYCICEDVYIDNKLAINPEIDMKLAKIAYIGTPNKEYRYSGGYRRSDEAEVKV